MWRATYPFAGDLYVFRGVRGNLIKILWHDGLGMSLYAKRLEKGRFTRPVVARPEPDEGCIYVVTDLRSAKEHEIERDPHMGLTFIDQRTNAYLALSPRAAVIANPATIKKYWRSTDSMWWKGPDDPNVRVLRAELTSGALWDGSASKAV